MHLHQDVYKRQIYDRCADDLTEEQIEMVLELQQEFLDSKGLIELEEDDLY